MKKHGMPAQYSEGLSPKVAARRAAAQKRLSKKYKEGKMTPSDYETKLPGD